MKENATHSSQPKEIGKKTWYSIKQAAEYLEIGEPTLYRWMRDGKITYRKVGDSTRFWQEDLDAVMEVFHSSKDVEKEREICQVCRNDQLVEGKVRSTGLLHFTPNKTKFWKLMVSNVAVHSKMCARCGVITWFGDVEKLSLIKEKAIQANNAETSEDAFDPPSKSD